MIFLESLGDLNFLIVKILFNLSLSKTKYSEKLIDKITSFQFFIKKFFFNCLKSNFLKKDIIEIYSYIYIDKFIFHIKISKLG